MRTYTVQVRPGGPPDDPDLVLVKEGFSWPALILGPIWFAWMRVWRWLIAYLAVLAAASLGLGLLEAAESLGSVVGVAVAVLFAAQANDARRAALARRGYRFAGLARAPRLAEAERRALDRWPPRLLVEGVP
ncbi:DUF2628 domain-containing protein [Desertibaculum subflavum]|uniref:DUF2628 domain-containing protein n=1 Tax=Desertibaculum subflavum TaxID=2268458 RepID=UPI000E66D932